jgi:competence ComEA-like helix-hairpin-helix protein
VRLWGCLTVFLALRACCAGVLMDSGGLTRPVVRPLRVDLNRAPLGELVALPGVGPKRAIAIVLDRLRRGPFATVGDLTRVGGIGDETLARLRPYLIAQDLPPSGAGF